MISLAAYRASIGCFLGCLRKIMQKNKTDLCVHDNLSMNCFFETYKKYISLCFIRKYMPILLNVFDTIGLSDASKPFNFIKLILSGDVEKNLGPDSLDTNVKRTDLSLKSPGRPKKQKRSFPIASQKIDNVKSSKSQVAESNNYQLIGSEINTPHKLENKNNVCFANASFQLLSVIPEFIECVKCNTCYSPLDHALKNTFTSMGMNNCYSIDTSEYVKDMMRRDWICGDQQDAHEFLDHILTNAYQSELINIFNFNLRESVICESDVCQQRVCNSKVDSMFFFNLPLEETSSLQSIDYLIHKYLYKEKISDYMCGKDEQLGCKLEGFSYKSQNFSEAPNTFMIQLKVYDSGGNKLDNFNISVDEKLKICGETIYLHGIIFHEGNSVTSGHYYSEILYNGIWYLANDTNVRQISKPSTLSDPMKTPYILLYRKLISEIHFSIENSDSSDKEIQANVLKQIELENNHIDGLRRQVSNLDDKTDSDSLEVSANEHLLYSDKTNPNKPTFKSEKMPLFDEIQLNKPHIKRKATSSSDRSRKFRSTLSEVQKECEKESVKK
jgi:ubiquitin C-terminal hydrolase